MKHCPECNRNYADPTLSFCLEDGASLIFGNALNEPETAMLLDHRTSEAPTKELSRSDGALGPRVTNRNSLIAGAVGILLITALGVGSYWYYGRGGDVIDSIAVMPFENQSGNPDVDYLSEGMTETLINTLTQLPSLNVRPRSSAIRFKNSDTKTVGEQLKVRAVLNGRLIQRGDEITLFLSLVDTADEKNIWGKQYTRKLANLVALQTEISRDVADSLKPRLARIADQPVAKGETTNPEAYRLYLQGRFFWNKRRIGPMGNAIGYFQQAIDLDPNYAKAYAGLADAVSQPNDVVPFPERSEKARAALVKALSIDAELAEAHTALGHILLRFNADFDGAERELSAALKLDPKWIDTYQRYSELYTYLGKHDEALAKCREGLEIEPFNIPLNASCGAVSTYARRYDEAVTQLRRTVDLAPDHRNAHMALAMVYSLKGMYAESVKHRIEALKLADQNEWAEAVREGFAKAGWPGALNAELAEFDKQGISPDRRPHYFKAAFLVALGENEAAFSELEKSFESHETPNLVLLKTDPRFEPLRNDPRFPELLKRIGFPD